MDCRMDSRMDPGSGVEVNTRINLRMSPCSLPSNAYQYPNRGANAPVDGALYGCQSGHRMDARIGFLDGLPNAPANPPANAPTNAPRMETPIDSRTTVEIPDWTFECTLRWSSGWIPERTPNGRPHRRFGWTPECTRKCPADGDPN